MGNGTCNPGSEASLNVKRELIWVPFFKKSCGDGFNLFVAVWRGDDRSSGVSIKQPVGKGRCIDRLQS
jgi:hypothetical protein